MNKRAGGNKNKLIRLHWLLLSHCSGFTYKKAGCNQCTSVSEAGTARQTARTAVADVGGRQGSRGGAGIGEQGGDGDWTQGQGDKGEKGDGRHQSAPEGAGAQACTRVMVGDRARGFIWET